jgi:hypothetical protein
MFAIIFICFLLRPASTAAFNTDDDAPSRVGDERSPGADHMQLPPILLYSLQMTVAFAKREYFRLTLESMRRNPLMEFVIIAIVDDIAETKNAQEYIDRAAASNIKMVPITVAQFKATLKTKLGIEHTMQQTSEVWARKLPDFKPVVAHLFREHLLPKHKYWGYCDMDVIWGNVSHYAHWFQGEYPVVKTNFFPHGPLQFFANIDTFIEMYAKSNSIITDTADYSKALLNETYYNLDELGMWTSDTSYYFLSMDYVFRQYTLRNNIQWNSNGDDKKVNVMIDTERSLTWRFGSVIWQNGALKIISSSAVYPAGREIMFYHRPRPNLGLSDLSSHMRRDIVDDMIAYGFVLPTWTPLMTRYVCKHKVARTSNIYDYKPFSRSCFGRNTSDNVVIRPW